MIDKNSPVFKAICSMSHPIEAEQDYLECQILDALFADASLSDKLVFSGGATLSKSYNMRYRNSHDLDLICTDFTDVPQERSRRQLQNFKNRFKDFVFDQLGSSIIYAINQDEQFVITTDRNWRILNNPEQRVSYPVLHVQYKSVLNDSIGHICIEVMPRKCNPSAVSFRAVVPYALNMPTREIPTVAYAQTFWDKVFALHCLATGVSARTNDFYSRHYFDVAQMADMINIGDTFYMFQDTVAYQTRYTTKDIVPVSNPSSICIMPSNAIMRRLEADYHSNTDQFIGNQPKWDDIIKMLMKFNTRLTTFNQGR